MSLYLSRRLLTIAGACTDSNGTASPTGHLNTSTAGRHAYTVTATSADGLSSTARISYVVGPSATRPGTSLLRALTPRGSQLLKRAKRLELTAHASFRPAGPHASVASKRFTLTR
jgi:hypothetical protein